MAKLTEFNQSVIDELIIFINQNPTEKLTVRLLADRAGFSPWHLQRLFRFYKGIPLGSYIKKLKMHNAALTLMNSQKSVLDVALEYGYETAQTFTRAISSHFGTPPGALRKLSAEEQSLIIDRFCIPRWDQHDG